MRTFLARHRDSITGTLSGLDRIVFRGVLRQLSHSDGLFAYLTYKRVLLRDFKHFVEHLTKTIKDASLGAAEKLGRPVIHLNSSRDRKEDLARAILAKDPVDQGLVCVLKCVEPCQSFDLHRSRSSKRLELRSTLRKCLHLYHYYLHPCILVSASCTCDCRPGCPSSRRSF